MTFDQRNRREFLAFLGMSSAAVALLTTSRKSLALTNDWRSLSLPASSKDELALAKGLSYDIVVGHGDVLNAKGETFGYDNDFTATIPLSESELLLWVNHESVNPVLVSGFVSGQKRSREQVDIERKAVGGSIVKLRRQGAETKWSMVANDALNRRFDATTIIPFSGGIEIKGKKAAVGTLANCSGGVTPWQTFLSCEENSSEFYGDIDFDAAALGQTARTYAGDLKWQEFYDLPPEHYGWVVEIEPQKGEAKKLINLGRFAHEGALVVKAKDSRAVVYMGDDANDQCLYKFIAAKKDSLDEGTLYVADLKAGRWLPLTREANPKLKAAFKSQTELMIWTRRAARIAGGTPLDRPEGIALQPGTARIVVSLTNNKKKGNFFGSLLKLEEKNGDFLATEFTPSTLLTGGPESGFACPDNVCFDRRGNLWMTNDISQSELNRGSYAPFGNNSLWCIPMTGAAAGQPIRVANAPIEAEFTGPSFAPDGKTLFLSVQHPGQQTTSLGAPTSNWPTGHGLPRCAVVAISGPLLTQL